MTWSDLDLHPTRTKLRSFALLFLAVTAALACWQTWAHDRLFAAAALLATGAFVGILGLTVPRAVRPIYLGMTLGTFPLGWIMSHLLLGLVYFGLFTPLAIAFRLVGRDLLKRKLAASAATYLRPRSNQPASTSYFRPY